MASWDNSTSFTTYIFIPLETGEHEIILTAYNQTDDSLYTSYRWNFEVLSVSLMMEIIDVQVTPDKSPLIVGKEDNITITATINQLANCSWSVDGVIEEWDNLTVSPEFNISFSGVGTYTIALYAHNITDNQVKAEYTIEVVVAHKVGPDCEFTSIQDAINSANDGDTILVESGIISGNLAINKSVILIGETNGLEKPVIDGMGGNSTVNITADEVTIRGFQITNSTVGITTESNDGEIIGNDISDVRYGIWLNNSSGFTISDNSVDAEVWAFVIENSEATFGNNEIQDVTFNFEYSGDVRIGGVSSQGYPDDPEGWENIGKYLNINSTEWLFLNMTYSDSDVEGLDEQTLKIWRYNNGWHEEGWFEITTLDSENNTVGVNITKFSIFSILGKKSQQDLGEPDGQDGGDSSSSNSGGGSGGYSSGSGSFSRGGSTFLPKVQDLLNIKLNEAKEDNEDTVTPPLWNKKISPEPVTTKDDSAQNTEPIETQEVEKTESDKEAPKGLTSTKIILTIFLISVSTAIIVYAVKRKDLLDRKNNNK